MQYRTFTEAFERTVERHPSQGFTFLDRRGAERRLSFTQLEAASAQRAGALEALGLARGDRVGLCVQELDQFVISFVAAARIGVAPFAVAPPGFLRKTDVFVAGASSVVRAADARALILGESLAAQQEVRDGLANALAQDDVRIAGVNDLEERAARGIAAPSPDAIAFLQFSSGSTGTPKGIAIRHEALVANARAFMVEGLDMQPERDIGVSWLPLFHDMGLVGFMLGPICEAISVTLMPVERFIVNPATWLDAMVKYRGTTTFAPNFAYARLLQKLQSSPSGTWDLSHVRTFGWGAEPIQPALLRELTNVMESHCGLPRRAMRPSYGLAESTLAVTMNFTRSRAEPRILHVDRGEFVAARNVVIADQQTDALEHISCGVPFAGHRVEIRGDNGELLPEGQEGEIFVVGPSIAHAYFNNPAASAELIEHDALRTGDLGYLHEGELYVTGRVRELIVVNGKNIHPHSIEWPVMEIEGVCRAVALCRSGRETEEIVLVVETKRADQGALRELIFTRCFDACGVTPRVIMFVKPGTVPRTTSGKLRRTTLLDTLKAQETRLEMEDAAQ